MPDNPTAPVKRTTIVVRDLERSLAFYRDTLGMDVFYRGLIGNPGASLLTGIDCKGLDMAVLSAQGQEQGMIGLMAFVEPETPLPETEWTPRLRAGETILVIPTEHMRRLHERMLAGGFTVVTPPTRMEVPGRGEIHEMMARDPDGVVVNLTQRGPLR